MGFSTVNKFLLMSPNLLIRKTSLNKFDLVCICQNLFGIKMTWSRKIKSFCNSVQKLSSQIIFLSYDTNLSKYEWVPRWTWYLWIFTRNCVTRGYKIDPVDYIGSGIYCFVDCLIFCWCSCRVQVVRSRRTLAYPLSSGITQHRYLLHEI